MISKLLIAFVAMGLSVAIHASGMVSILRWVQSTTGSVTTFGPVAWRLIRVAARTVLLHLAQIVMWAAIYVLGKAMPDFTSAAYFSAVTYTTTGYGDLVLPQEWRLVGGIEALTGILMCGLSTGMFFAVFSELFDLQNDSNSSRSA